MFDIFNQALSGNPLAIGRLFGYAFVANGLYMFWYLKRIHGWSEVEGKLNNFKYVRGDSHGWGGAKISYFYSVNDKEYKGWRLIPLQPRAHKNDTISSIMKKVEISDERKVIVIYNPNKPKSSYLLKPGKREFFYITALFAFGVFLVGKLHFWF